MTTSSGSTPETDDAAAMSHWEAFKATVQVKKDEAADRGHRAKVDDESQP